MTTRLFLLPCVLVLCGCNTATGRTTQAMGVEPGLASCLVAINRPDVAANPAAPMSAGEIGALVTCTAERAGG